MHYISELERVRVSVVAALKEIDQQIAEMSQAYFEGLIEEGWKAVKISEYNQDEIIVNIFELLFHPEIDLGMVCRKYTNVPISEDGRELDLYSTSDKDITDATSFKQWLKEIPNQYYIYSGKMSE